MQVATAIDARGPIRLPPVSSAFLDPISAPEQHGPTSFPACPSPGQRPGQGPCPWSLVPTPRAPVALSAASPSPLTIGLSAFPAADARAATSSVSTRPPSGRVGIGNAAGTRGPSASSALAEQLDAHSAREPKLTEVLTRPLANAQVTDENTVTLRFGPQPPPPNCGHRASQLSLSARNGAGTYVTQSPSLSTSAFNPPAGPVSPQSSARANERQHLEPVSLTHADRVDGETSSARLTLTQSLSQVSLVSIRRRPNGPGGRAHESRSGQSSLATSRTVSPRGDVPRLELHTSFVNVSSREDAAAATPHHSARRSSGGSAVAPAALLDVRPTPTHEALHIELPRQETARLELQALSTTPPAARPPEAQETHIAPPNSFSTLNQNAPEGEEQELPVFTDGDSYQFDSPAPIDTDRPPVLADAMSQMDGESVEGVVCEIPDIEPTLWPAYPFDVLDDALRLHRALSGTRTERYFKGFLIHDIIEKSENRISFVNY